MNKQRRNSIRKEIANLKAVAFESNKYVIVNKLSKIYNSVEFIFDQEEYYMEEGIPENMQGGSRYEKAEEACDNLRDAIDYIFDAKESAEDQEELIKNVNKAIESLISAMV